MVSSLPGAGIFCPTYLEQEMLHVQRHVTGLREFRPVIVAEKLKGRWSGPIPVVIRKSRAREVGRFFERLNGRPWQIGRAQASGIARAWDGCALAHIFFGSVAAHALNVTRRWKGPLIVSFHGSDVTGGFASVGYRKAREELFARATLVACRSTHLLREVEKLGCPESKLRILRTALPDRPRGTPPAPSEDGCWKILLAGRLVPKKGVSTALRAFALFAKKFPRAKFLVAGEGPLRDELAAEARVLGVAGAVEFCGFLSQGALAEAMRETHIYFHPSETVGGDVEGVPNAMVEAMWAARPCVSTIHGGIPEIVNHGKSGLLLPERDVRGLADALISLASDPALLRAIAENGQKAVESIFLSGSADTLYREAAGLRV